MIRLMFIFIGIFSSSFSYALRDIFNVDASYFLQTSSINIAKEDLNFLGSVIEKHKSIAFLEDNIGNVYQVKMGCVLAGSRVIKIYPDEILLSDGQHFSVIK